MGSTQSISNLSRDASTTITPVESTPPTTNSNTDSTSNVTKRPRKERKGFDLVQYKCRRKKAAYDKCYAEWYGQKFLTAKDINQDASCDDLFDDWKECVLRGMLKERQRQGAGPPKEGSILAEYLEEQSDE